MAPRPELIEALQRLLGSNPEYNELIRLGVVGHPEGAAPPVERPEPRPSRVPFFEPLLEVVQGLAAAGPNALRAAYSSDGAASFFNDYDPELTYGQQYRELGMTAPEVVGFGTELAEPGPGDLAPLMATLGLPAALMRYLGRTTRVLDHSGNPRRVMHGTGAVFEEMDPAYLDQDSLYGPGFYFSEGAYQPSTSGPFKGMMYEPVTSGYAGYPQYSEIRSVVDANGNTYSVGQPIDWPSADSTFLDDRDTPGIPVLRRSLGPLQGTVREFTQSGPVLIAIVEDSSGQPVRAQLHNFRVNEGVQTRTPNVRGAYLDIRNPFDTERLFTDEEFSSMLRELQESGLTQDQVGQLEYRMSGRPFGWKRGDIIYEELTDILGGDKGLTNLALQSAGFDGITHPGGRIMNGPSHKVWIAFDQNQIVEGPAAVERLTARGIQDRAIPPEDLQTLFDLIDARTRAGGNYGQ